MKKTSITLIPGRIEGKPSFSLLRNVYFNKYKCVNEKDSKKSAEFIFNGKNVVVLKIQNLDDQTLIALAKCILLAKKNLAA